MDGQHLAEQIRLLYEEVHGNDANSVPIAMGVPIDIPQVDVTPATVTGQPVMAGVTTVGAAIQEAIHIGAPTYNSGDVAGCYFVYRRTAEEMVSRLETNGAHARVREALIAVLLQAAVEAEAGGPRRAAWTIRHLFDELRTSRAQLNGMPTAQCLHGEYTCASHAESPVPGGDSHAGSTSLKRAISGAISAGAPVYNSGNFAGCYYIYRRVAQEAIRRLGDSSDAKRQLSSAIRRARARADGEGGQRADVDGAAWVLRLCFDQLLTASADPLLSDGMPTARAIKREAEFPGRVDLTSSCCSIA